ncbi:14460_t:CDS:2 [Gigaspora margarita]|uniref:14460_t:CDS:1 n=1 Tax=Gigaspora margarita TaxID=4874 RepID=A0ABM8VXP7_GIGMA|nr:14460_t:CDS:2 [Gigaspora margarita]
MDKKIDYWQLFAARHAMAILHYNEGYTYLLSELREIYCGKPFELADLHNINAIESACSAKQRWNVEKIQQCNKTQAEKYANEHKELADFNFDQDLVFYKKKALDQLHVNELNSSFVPLIVDFDEISLQKEMNKPVSLEEHIKIIAKEIFKFTELRPGQIDAIKYYVENKKDTLVMKTGRGKSFCYATAFILFDGLTVVISPLKSLIQNQVNHFIKLGIPCAGLVTLSQGTIEHKSKIMEEIALGFTRLLYVTPKKLLLNSSLKKEEWGKLGKLKEYFPKVQIMALTATLSQDNVYALRNNLNISEDTFKLQKDCKDVYKALNLKIEEIQLDIYHGQLQEDHKANVMKKWNKPNNPIPPECKLCDNCIRHEKDNVASFNAQLDSLELLWIITLLCKNNIKQIISLDVVEVFGCSKGA